MSLQAASIRRLFSVSGLVVALVGAAITGGSVAGAAPPPLAIEMQVSPGGTEARVIVRPTNPELIAVSHSVRRVNTGGTVVSPPRLPIRDVASIPTLVATTGDTPTLVQYVKQADIRLTRLQPNTAYEVIINASTQDGRTASARQTFTTLPQRVSLTLDKIVVHDDGDGRTQCLFVCDPDGEPRWRWTVDGFSGGPLMDCFPKNSAGRCGYEKAHDGEVYLPRTRAGQPYIYVFAQENFVAKDNTNAPPGSEDFTTMPTQFTLRAGATEDDAPISGGLDEVIGTVFSDWGAWIGSAPVRTWQVPQGVEEASQQVTIRVEDGTFESTMTFTFRVFHDSSSYPPNEGRVHSTAK